MRSLRQLFNIDQSAAFLLTKSRIVHVPQGGPVFRRKNNALGGRHVVLGAVVTTIDHGNAEVDQFVKLALERASHAPVKAQKILQHLRAVGERLLRISWFAAKRFLVDILY